MAAPIRQRPPSLGELLYRDPHRFDFYQAVALIEHARPDAARVGETAEPDREAVRFDSPVSSAFPAGDIQDLKPASRSGAPAEMTVNFMGLAGAHGPLPSPVTELVQDRLRERDSAFKAFLDIFNHRLVSLMYRARKVNRFWIGAHGPHDNPFARYLFAIAGLGTEGLRRHVGTPARAVLPYAGLLAHRPRTQAGLVALVVHHFGVAARVVPFRGRWLTIEPDQRTALGTMGRGRNNGLGRGAVLGARVWDRMSLFELRLGPMPFKRFRQLLPGGPAYEALVAITRLYAGDEFDADLRLCLDPRQAPATTLAVRGGSRLGWTSWLKTGAQAPAKAEIALSPRRLATPVPSTH